MKRQKISTPHAREVQFLSFFSGVSGVSCTADRLSSRGMAELLFSWVLFYSVLAAH